MLGHSPQSKFFEQIRLVSRTTKQVEIAGKKQEKKKTTNNVVVSSLVKYRYICLRWLCMQSIVKETF